MGSYAALSRGFGPAALAAGGALRLALDADAEPDAAADMGERLGELERGLWSDDAVRLAPALPLDREDVAQAPAGPAQAAYVRTLVDRLARLGYLSLDETVALDRLGSAAPVGIAEHPLLMQAVTRFQEEAGIHADGWSGPQTWNALQALYCFEGARAELGRHTHRAGMGERAMLRAALLRLDALGLVRQSIGAAPLTALDGLGLEASAAPDPDYTVRHLREALRDPLGLFAYVLGVLGAGEGLESDPDRLALVLDHDRLSARLAALDNPPAIERPRTRPAVPEVDGAYVVCSFIGRVLTVEMWLLNRDIGLRSETSPAVDGPVRDTLQGEIKHFLRELRDQDGADTGAIFTGPRGGRLDAAGIARDSLAHFPRILRAVQLVIADSAADLAVNDTLADPDKWAPGVAEAVEAEAQRERSRLWDGVRRAIGWVWRWIRRGIDVLATLARQVVRVVFAFSAEALNAARDALRVLREGLRHFVERRLVGPRGTMVAVRDGDFDYRVVALTGDRAALEADAMVLHLRTRAFEKTAEFTGRVVGACARIAMAIGTGWLRIGLALLQLSRRARHLARWMAETRQLAAQIRAIEARPF